ncbi:TetR/AcrR family transcriptional regulator [Micrococcales bacterium 31B]|nr:TetR/AcrR family transcriptional regulator [Micrococcales bacterium 31B]
MTAETIAASAASPAEQGASPRRGAKGSAEGASDHGSSTRERAMNIAMRNFTERGYDATSMREIAEELGVSKAALYYHFTSKEDIVRSLLDGYIADLNALDARVEAGMTFTELLDAWREFTLARGLRIARFNMVNQAVLKNFGVNKSMGRERLNGMLAKLAPADFPDASMVRLRLAFFMVSIVVFVREGLDLSEAEILAEAHSMALETIHGLGLR